MKTKQKTAKRFFVLLLACILLLTGTSVLHTGALAPQGSGAVSYETLEQAEAAMFKLYNDNYAEVAQKIREIRQIKPEERSDEALTLYYGSCGPTSIAFQKVLIDNGIYAETRMDSQMYPGHEYNLFRTRLADGSAAFILIDGSYRQFMRNYFRAEIMDAAGKSYDEVTDAEIDAALLSSGLPAVLIYAFGNKNEAVQKIKNVLGENVSETAYNWMDGAYESQPYPEPELQSIHTRYLTEEDVAALQAGLAYEKPFASDVYIKGSWDNFANARRFTYMGNGVYEVNLSVDSSAGGMFTFQITGTPLQYNGAVDATMYMVANYSYNHSTEQMFLTTQQGAGETLTVNTGDAGNFTVRFDTRAGIDTPFIRVLPTTPVGMYGDIDTNQTIDLQDVVTMQKALANQIEFTANQKILCNVSNSDTFSQADILMVQRYLAHGTGTGRTGHMAYKPV